MRKFWNHLARFIRGNSVPLTKAGHYLYVAGSSGTWNIVSSANIGNYPPDERTFRIDHAGGDLAVLTLLIQAADRLYEPSITGAVSQAFVSGVNSNLVTGQTRTTIQLTKGDTAQLTVHGRLWFWAITRQYLRSFAIPQATAAYQAKPYDNLVLYDTTTTAQAVTLPPIATMLINGEAREIEVMLTAGALAATLLPSGAETINGSAIAITLGSVGSKYRLRPISATNWGTF